VLSLESIQAKIEQAIPGAKLEIVKNDAPSAQHSLLVDNDHAVAVAKFLRDDSELRFDYASNMTGVDWPDLELSEKIKVKKVVDGVEKEVEEVKKNHASRLSRGGVSSILDGTQTRPAHHTFAD